MVSERRCLFCDHVFFAARRKFCFDCLPNHGSSHPKAYQRRYSDLYRACGLDLNQRPLASPWPRGRARISTPNKVRPARACLECGAPCGGREFCGILCKHIHSVKTVGTYASGANKRARPQHSGGYHVLSRMVRRCAETTPSAVCWRCGRTLNEHEAHKNGAAPRWTCGHTIDGSCAALPWLDVSAVPPDGDWLAPEVSTCNFASGATEVTRLRAQVERLTSMIGAMQTAR